MHYRTRVAPRWIACQWMLRSKWPAPFHLMWSHLLAQVGLSLGGAMQSELHWAFQEALQTSPCMYPERHFSYLGCTWPRERLLLTVSLRKWDLSIASLHFAFSLCPFGVTWCSAELDAGMGHESHLCHGLASLRGYLVCQVQPAMLLQSWVASTEALVVVNFSEQISVIHPYLH